MVYSQFLCHVPSLGWHMSRAVFDLFSVWSHCEALCTNRFSFFRFPRSFFPKEELLGQIQILAAPFGAPSISWHSLFFLPVLHPKIEILVYNGAALFNTGKCATSQLEKGRNLDSRFFPPQSLCISSQPFRLVIFIKWGPICPPSNCWLSVK